MITGIKPIKQRPYRDSDAAFNKDLPMGIHNFPLTKYTKWKIYGYKKDRFTGMKRPFWMEKTLPTGRQLTPQMCGLDGFFDVKSINQVI